MKYDNKYTDSKETVILSYSHTLKNTQWYSIQIFHADFYPGWSRNMEATDKKVLTPLSNHVCH